MRARLALLILGSAALGGCAYGYGYDRCGYDPFWGWYGGYYYPGTGYYVYDSYRRPYRWTDAQRRYWTERREKVEKVTGTKAPATIQPIWNDFSRQQADRRAARVEERQLRRAERVQTRENRQVERRATTSSTRSTIRESASDRRAQRLSDRQARRSARDDD